MRKYLIVLCGIFICFIGYSAFRIESSDAKELHSTTATATVQMNDFTNTKNIIYDKFFSTFPYCQPIQITDNSKDSNTDINKMLLLPINKLTIQKVDKSDVLLYSKKNLSKVALNKTTLKDSNIVVLKEIGNSNEFNFYIYNTNSLINNTKGPAISGQVQNNKIFNVTYN
ncbi:hypothetical protein [uncultured Clostridium sp.]|uniref:hypothetical protein n=1 Tax=uncultured Clostridium sp. TaxID=59620 RepID=UPI002604DF71|nr:hypothetical protein [uncultured Clostridium sp.]